MSILYQPIFTPVSSYRMVESPSIPVGEKLLGTTNTCSVMLEINAATIVNITFDASFFMCFFLVLIFYQPFLFGWFYYNACIDRNEAMKYNNHMNIFHM